jgi:Fe2+ or Zn2+ uptake regulation protein
MKEAPRFGGAGQGGITNHCPPDTAPDLTSQREIVAPMGAAMVNGACTTNARRGREEMAAIRSAIVKILKADHPQTVRQVFYQLVSRGVIDKTEAEYQRTVIRLLVEMRLDHRVDWDWIVDETRQGKITRTFDNVEDALRDTAQSYRRSALRDADVHVQVWCEKEALAGIIWDAASEYDVPVHVSRGVPSLTQIYSSFTHIRAAALHHKPSFIYQFGDHDPSGVFIPKHMEKRLHEFCHKYGVRPLPIIERIALTPEQIKQYRLPTRPTKREGNSYAKGFEGRSVELDALPSNTLRELVTACIERHISPQQVEALRAAEDSERGIIEAFASRAGFE